VSEPEIPASSSAASTVLDILGRAKRAGITLIAEQGRLRFLQSAPDFPADLRSQITEHKEAIIAFLQQVRTEDDPVPASRSTAACARASYAQERIWLAERVGAQSGGYNMSGAYRLTGPIDLSIAAQALTLLVERHESLRTALEFTDNGLLQVVRDPWHVSIDRGAGSCGSAGAEWMASVLAESQRTFDLAEGRLLRAAFLSLGKDTGVLVLTVHHVAADGHSLGLLLSEFSTAYRELLQGRSPAFPAIGLTYRDFSEWQRGLSDRPRMRVLQTYWQEKLRDIPMTHGLTTVASARGADFAAAGEYEASIPAAQFSALLELGAREGASPFAVIHAFVTLLLLSHSPGEEVVVGIPMANRLHAEWLPVVGMLVNMLPIRSSARAGSTFLDHLKASRRTIAEAMAHQDMPFDVISESLSHLRSDERSPVFQIALSLQSDNATALNIDGVGVDPVAIPESAKYELAIDAKIDASGCRLVFRYMSHSLAGSSKALAAEAPALARAVAESPEVDLVSVLARLRGVLDTTIASGQRDSIHPRRLDSLFEERVREDGAAVALCMGDDEWTYAALNERASAIAGLIARQGVAARAPIAVCMTPSPDMIAAVIGVLKAGGVYLPIDPSLPDGRIAFILDDASPVAILADKEYLHRFDSSAAPLLTTGMASLVDRDAGSLIAAGPKPDGAPAYVIYTSGSTGSPKGVAIDHEAISERLLWASREYSIGPGERGLFKASVSFDISIWEIFAPLISGGCVVVAPASAKADPDAIEALLSRQRVTSVHFVPSALDVFLREDAVLDLPHLRHVFCGGEALSQELYERASAALAGCTVHNLYGPTEATILATFWRPDHDPCSYGVPIGKPVEGVRLYALGRSGFPLPVGVAGELCIGGSGVARGYLNRPELTQEKFVSDPFATGVAERMYRTGDTAFRGSDGMWYYVGRQDAQLKIRGHRIEPAEVEMALRRLPRVRDAVVVAIGSSTAATRLVAYIVAQPGELRPDAEALRDGMLTSLPQYMVPSSIVVLDRWPLNVSGKIDRDRLPAPDIQPAGDANRANTHPEDAFEARLATIWGEILGIASPGRYDNFFAAGGTSLTLVKTARVIDEAFSVKVELAELFKVPVLKDMAALVRTQAEPRKHVNSRRISIDL